MNILQPHYFSEEADQMAVKYSAIMNLMRILKKINPGDTYYEAYQGHLQRAGINFYDIYVLFWELGACHPPKRILEIGTRTGISLCQLLSAYLDHSVLEKAVAVDIFADGFTSPALVKRNLAYLNLPVDKVEIIKGSSFDVLPELYEKGETFDFILVDGDHAPESCMRDLENAHLLCEAGGFIVCDDLSPAPGECNLVVVWDKWKELHEDQYYFFQNLHGKGCGYAVKK